MEQLLGQKIGKDEINKATEILRKYKDGKAHTEQTIVANELWWKLRHWEAIGKKPTRPGEMPQPTSAWLFNSILNKHADAMDNYPEPIVLPREQSDKGSAKLLSEVLPVVLEYNDFEQTYSTNWWEKLKHGTAVYGIFWDNSKENGLGDVAIKPIDMLKIYWEPGITDIQQSQNLFIVELVDEEVLDKQYPQYKGKMQGNAVDVKEYLYDENIDTHNKSVVVDWYYKTNINGRSVLQYAKYVGDVLLYASENEPEYAERGYYDHGEYPVVFDVMFPDKGSPAGFGFVQICRDPQLYIDRLSQNILENSLMATKRRYFASTATNINKEQFKDWNEPIVDVEGELDDRRLKEITTTPMSGIYANIVQMKIDEMKETAANRDFNTGSNTGGVTAASAIAALQEAGNKVSRDMIAASYRAFNRISAMVIELIRQFYDEGRAFRISAPNGMGYDFVQFSNAQLKPQATGMSRTGEMLYRKPIFDLKIKAQKRNPFTRMEQNQRAQELFKMGFFNPQAAQPALACLDCMEFEGIEDVREKIQQGQTLYNMLIQVQQENIMLKAALGIPVEQPGPQGQQPQGQPGNVPIPEQVQAQRPQPGYMERLAGRARVKME